MKNDQQCAHAACGCAVSDAKYCSSHCETAGDGLDITCGCQHSGCAASDSRPSDPSIVANLQRDPEDRSVAADGDELREKMMDKTLADSYPASDPPSTIPNPSEDSLTQRD